MFKTVIQIHKHFIGHYDKEIIEKDYIDRHTINIDRYYNIKFVYVGQDLKNIYQYFHFYFPGHGLKSIDLVCMKKLDTKVNIIPIIAKADTISKTELQKFKVCTLLV